MRVAVDAMGGDHGPKIMVPGALAALAQLPGETRLLLLGDEEKIGNYLDRDHQGSRVEIVHAPQEISMHDSPATAVRRKPNSPLAVAYGALRQGEVDAMVSAGSTGAVVAGALLTLGRIGRLRRPAIATLFPTERGRCVVLDSGANSECKPLHLLQFAIMGTVYARLLLKIETPRVGLLNIGEEESKGSELAAQAFQLLKKSSLNFIGNVEGRDVLLHKADVVVCDGFVGNIVLKFGESMLKFLSRQLRQEISRSRWVKLGALLMRPAFQRLRTRIDYQEAGGAPLLGVNGIVTIAHGSSSERAITNAVLTSALLVENNLKSKIEELLEDVSASSLAT